MSPTRRMPAPVSAMRLSDHPEFGALKEMLKDGFVRTGFAGGVTRLPLDDVVADMLSDARIDEQIAQMAAWTDLAGQRILEIGSGCGALVTRACAAYGLDVRGVEPSVNEFEATFQVARRLSRHFGLADDRIVDAAGEALPFPDGSFDLVYSSNVLEHVRDPQAVLAEAIRVLRPGGLLLFVVPNYGSWWEGHYGILWLPNLPARSAKLYVRVLGRDPSYIDTLNLVNKRRLQHWLGPHAADIQILDWGFGVFEHRLRTLQFSEWAALGILKRLTTWVHRLHLVDLIVSLSRRLDWETPLILVARKKGIGQ